MIRLNKIFITAAIAALAPLNAQEVSETQVITPNMNTYEEKPLVVKASAIHGFQVPASLVQESDTFLTQVNLNQQAQDREADKDPEERDPNWQAKPEAKPKWVTYKQVILTVKKNEVSSTTGRYTKQNFNVTASLTKGRDGQYYYVGTFPSFMFYNDLGEYVWGVFDPKAVTEQGNSTNIKQYLGVVEIIKAGSATAEQSPENQAGD